MDRYADLWAMVNDMTIAQVRHKIVHEYGCDLWEMMEGATLDGLHREQLVSIYAELDAREG